MKQMAKQILTDAQVEEEIARLTNSPYVKLAKEQERIKYQRRQYLYKLRGLEKKGKALYDKGIDIDTIDDYVRSLLGNECDFTDERWGDL